MRWVVVIIAIAWIFSCKSGQRAGATDEMHMQKLISWMGGSFDSAEQSKNDRSYYDITLHMYPMWTDRSDGPWLYVEQAVSARPDNPYRQRMYQLKTRGGDLESHVYELPNPEEVVGGWIGGTPLDTMGPKDLIKRQGCTVYMTWDEKRSAFVGSTKPGACKSSLRGAEYAESEVVISEDQISSWDRGYDQAGQQVWGAENGPYIFRRKTEMPD